MLLLPHPFVGDEPQRITLLDTPTGLRRLFRRIHWVLVASHSWPPFVLVVVVVAVEVISVVVVAVVVVVVVVIVVVVVVALDFECGSSCVHSPDGVVD